MQYKYLIHRALDALEEVINEHAAEGWRLVGTPIFNPEGRYVAFMQREKKE